MCFYMHKYGAYTHFDSRDDYVTYVNEDTAFEVGWQNTFSGPVKAASIVIR